MQPSVANIKRPKRQITIANMSEHDLLEVVEIEEQSRLSRWGWAAYYAELQGINRPLMLVARISNSPLARGNSIAGYIVARLSAGELHINNVAVRTEFRGQGIGKELLTRILAQGKSLKLRWLFSNCAREIRLRSPFMKRQDLSLLANVATTIRIRSKMP
jgi:ribosomal protein S18 acetylase RimI-like enzyme